MSYLVLLSLFFSVVIGGFFVTYLQKTNNTQIIKLLLAFSGGFLLSIAFSDFIPDIYSDGARNMGVFILIGFLVQLLLEFFSGGIEHGHVHVHNGQQMPWGLFISLSVHSVLEGIPLGNQLIDPSSPISDHGGDENSLFLGILFHQIPVAIALMTLLVNCAISAFRSWSVLLLFGAMTPIGVLLGMFTNTQQFGLDYHVILAIVVGMFLHISTTIIFETSENHKFNLLKLVAILVGCIVAIGMN